MKVLVIGQGGREHAMIKALKLSPSVSEVHAFSGSDGISHDALCHAWDGQSVEPVVAFIKNTHIDLVVIGPEVPLANGLADELRRRNILVVGPNKKQAQLEASKIFAKEFMLEAGVPTAKYQEVKSIDELLKASEKFSAPYIFKADGLAAGKGVFVCKDIAELSEAGHRVFVKKELGEAGQRAFIEEFKSGWELSYLILTNGISYRPLPLAQDHKRLSDGDLGPNTGGMGVVAPLKIDAALETQIQSLILSPIMELMQKKNWDYRGILYIGMMITPEGPSVLEFNVRFGDPEAQAILPLLYGDWGQVFMALANGELITMRWRPLFCTCVVMAAPGYPEAPKKNIAIEGNISYETHSSYFLHAGTKKDAQGKYVTQGGRVLNAVGLGSTLMEAIELAYSQANKVSWPGLQIRTDIGQRVLNKNILEK
ncbi:MAG: phosphoribosylamine--glycine ligase [Pseudomonadota bacterium]|nr:phosphoribosylamine--glycine ligase [Pseudomonadota bacterium]